MAAAARAMPAVSPSCSRPPRSSNAVSAAAALSRTASRTGPGSPSTSRRKTAALNAGSPPRSAPSGGTARPRAKGSTRSGSTSPSRTTQTDDVVAVVSSSRPSSPRKTIARVPRPASTAARTGAMRRSAQPMAAATGRAGLVSGPRKLKTVPMPISRRGAPVCRKPGWKTGAKKKPIPASCTQRATPGAGRSMTTPSASSTSADPDDDDAARLPCLATGTPAAAATTAAIEEMLTVWAPSPPVPTMSTQSIDSCTGVACASISAARPATSSADSPLARSATAKAATWTGVASPVITSRIAQDVSDAERSSRASNRVNSAGQVGRPSIALIGGLPTGDGAPHVSAQQIRHHTGCGERVDRERERALRAGPVRQPAVGLAGDQDADRGPVGDLLVELTGQRETPRGLRLAVEDAQVHAPGVHRGDDLVTGVALDPVQGTDVRGGPAPDRRPDGVPDLGAVAVDQHGGRHRGGAAGVGGGAHAAEPSARPGRFLNRQ